MKTAPPTSRVIAIANQKGGVGKTTVSLMLAGFFQASGRRTVIVDADPQGTAREWAKRGAEAGATNPTVLNLGKGPAMLIGLRDLRLDWRIIIIDCPPRLGGETLAAMTSADLLLMPLAPLPADAWALAETLSILDHARGANPGVTAQALLNRTGRSSLGRSIEKDIEREGVAICNTVLRERIAHSEAMAYGRTVLAYAPESDAAIETRRLGAEVSRLLGGAS